MGRIATIAAALVALGIATSAPAHAERLPPPASSWGAGVTVDLHGIGDRFLFGYGLGASHAWQAGPVAVVAEGAVARVSVATDEDGQHAGGYTARGGIGLRAIPAMSPQQAPPWKPWFQWAFGFRVYALEAGYALAGGLELSWMR